MADQSKKFKRSYTSSVLPGRHRNGGRNNPRDNGAMQYYVGDVAVPSGGRRRNTQGSYNSNNMNNNGDAPVVLGSAPHQQFDTLQQKSQQKAQQLQALCRSSAKLREVLSTELSHRNHLSASLRKSRQRLDATMHLLDENIQMLTKMSRGKSKTQQQREKARAMLHEMESIHASLGEARSTNAFTSKLVNPRDASSLPGLSDHKDPEHDVVEPELIDASSMTMAQLQSATKAIETRISRQRLAIKQQKSHNEDVNTQIAFVRKETTKLSDLVNSLEVRCDKADHRISSLSQSIQKESKALDAVMGRSTLDQDEEDKRYDVDSHDDNNAMDEVPLGPHGAPLSGSHHSASSHSVHAEPDPSSTGGGTRTKYSYTSTTKNPEQSPIFKLLAQKIRASTGKEKIAGPPPLLQELRSRNTLLRQVAAALTSLVEMGLSMHSLNVNLDSEAGFAEQIDHLTGILRQSYGRSADELENSRRIIEDLTRKLNKASQESATKSDECDSLRREVEELKRMRDQYTQDQQVLDDVRTLRRLLAKEERKNKDLLAQNDDLKQQLAEKDELLDNIKGELRRSQESVAFLQSEFEHQGQLLTKSRAENKKLQDMYREAQAEFASGHGTDSDQLAKYKRRCEALKKDVDSLRTLVEELESDLKSKDAEGAAVKKEHAEEKAAWEKQIADLRAELEEQQKSMEDRERAHKQAVDALEQTIATLHGQVDSLSGKHKDAKKELARLRDRTLTLEQDVASLQGQLADEAQRYQALQAKYQELEDARLQLQLAHSELKSEADELKAQLRALRDELADAHNRIKQLESQLKAAEQTIATLRVPLDAAGDSPSTLPEALDELRRLAEQLAQLNQQLLDKENQLKALRDANRELELKLEMERRANKQHGHTIADLTRDIAALRRALLADDEESKVPPPAGWPDTGLHDRVQRLSKDKAALEDENDENSRALDALTGEFGQLNDFVRSRLRDKLRRLEAENKGLRTRVAEMPARYEAAIAELDAEVADLKHQLALAQQDLKHKDEEIERLRGQLADARADFLHEKNKHKGKDSRINELLGQGSEASAQLQAALDEKAALARDLDRERAKSRRNAANLKKLQDEMKLLKHSLGGDVDELQRERDALAAAVLRLLKALNREKRGFVEQVGNERGTHRNHCGRLERLDKRLRDLGHYIDTTMGSTGRGSDKGGLLLSSASPRSASGLPDASDVSGSSGSPSPTSAGLHSREPNSYDQLHAAGFNDPSSVVSALSSLPKLPARQRRQPLRFTPFTPPTTPNVPRQRKHPKQARLGIVPEDDVPAEEVLHTEAGAPNSLPREADVLQGADALEASLADAKDNALRKTRSGLPVALSVDDFTELELGLPSASERIQLEAELRQLSRDKRNALALLGHDVADSNMSLEQLAQDFGELNRYVRDELAGALRRAHSAGQSAQGLQAQVAQLKVENALLASELLRAKSDMVGHLTEDEAKSNSQLSQSSLVHDDLVGVRAELLQQFENPDDAALRIARDNNGPSAAHTSSADVADDTATAAEEKTKQGDNNNTVQQSRSAEELAQAAQDAGLAVDVLNEDDTGGAQVVLSVNPKAGSGVSLKLSTEDADDLKAELHDAKDADSSTSPDSKTQGTSDKSTQPFDFSRARAEANQLDARKGLAAAGAARAHRKAQHALDEVQHDANALGALVRHTLPRLLAAMREQSKDSENELARLAAKVTAEKAALLEELEAQKAATAAGTQHVQQLQDKLDEMEAKLRTSLGDPQAYRRPRHQLTTKSDLTPTSALAHDPLSGVARRVASDLAGNGVGIAHADDSDSDDDKKNESVQPSTTKRGVLILPHTNADGKIDWGDVAARAKALQDAVGTLNPKKVAQFLAQHGADSIEDYYKTQEMIPFDASVAPSDDEPGVLIVRGRVSHEPTHQLKPSSSSSASSSSSQSLQWLSHAATPHLPVEFGRRWTSVPVTTTAHWAALDGDKRALRGAVKRERRAGRAAREDLETQLTGLAQYLDARVPDKLAEQAEQIRALEEQIATLTAQLEAKGRQEKTDKDGLLTELEQARKQARDDQKELQNLRRKLRQALDELAAVKEENETARHAKRALEEEVVGLKAQLVDAEREQEEQANKAKTLARQARELREQIEMEQAEKEAQQNKALQISKDLQKSKALVAEEVAVKEQHARKAEELTEEVKVLAAQLEEEREEKDAHWKASQDLETELIRLRGQLQDVQTGKEHTEDQTKALEDKLKRLVADLERERQQRQEHEDQYHKVQMELGNMESDLRRELAAKDTKDRSLAALHDNVAALTAQLKEQQQANTDYTARVAQLEADLAAAQGGNDLLSADKKQLRDRVEELQRKLARMQSGSQAQEDETSQARELIAAQEEALDGLRTANAQLRKDLDQLRADRDTLYRSKQDVDDQLATLKDAYEAQELELDELRAAEREKERSVSPIDPNHYAHLFDRMNTMMADESPVRGAAVARPDWLDQRPDESQEDYIERLKGKAAQLHGENMTFRDTMGQMGSALQKFQGDLKERGLARTAEIGHVDDAQGAAVGHAAGVGSAAQDDVVFPAGMVDGMLSRLKSIMARQDPTVRDHSVERGKVAVSDQAKSAVPFFSADLQDVEEEYAVAGAFHAGSATAGHIGKDTVVRRGRVGLPRGRIPRLKLLRGPDERDEDYIARLINLLKGVEADQERLLDDIDGERKEVGRELVRPQFRRIHPKRAMSRQPSESLDDYVIRVIDRIEELQGQNAELGQQWDIERIKRASRVPVQSSEQGSDEDIEDYIQRLKDTVNRLREENQDLLEEINLMNDITDPSDRPMVSPSGKAAEKLRRIQSLKRARASGIPVYKWRQRAGESDDEYKQRLMDLIKKLHGEHEDTLQELERELEDSCKSAMTIQQLQELADGLRKQLAKASQAASAGGIRVPYLTDNLMGGLYERLVGIVEKADELYGPLTDIGDMETPVGSQPPIPAARIPSPVPDRQPTPVQAITVETPEVSMHAAELERELEQSREELDEERAKRLMLERRVGELSDRVAVLQHQLSSDTREFEAMQDQVQQLANARNEAERQMGLFKGELVDVETALRDKTLECERLTAKLYEVQSAHKQSLASPTHPVVGKLKRAGTLRRITTKSERFGGLKPPGRVREPGSPLPSPKNSTSGLSRLKTAVSALKESIYGMKRFVEARASFALHEQQRKQPSLALNEQLQRGMLNVGTDYDLTEADETEPETDNDVYYDT